MFKAIECENAFDRVSDFSYVYNIIIPIVFKTCVYTLLRYYICSVEITTYDEIPNTHYLMLHTNTLSNYSWSYYP